MELLHPANPADNYVSLRRQSGFVMGAGAGEGRGSRVDYHKKKQQLRRCDTSPLGSKRTEQIETSSDSFSDDNKQHILPFMKLEPQNI